MPRRQDRRFGSGPLSRTDTTTVAALYEVFERLRRRHDRLGRLVRRREAEAEELRQRSRGRISTAVARNQAGYHALWTRWSASHDEVAAAADRLLRARARSLADVLMLFGALEWILLCDGVIVDSTAERQVRRFGRGLRRLTAAS